MFHKAVLNCVNELCKVSLNVVSDVYTHFPSSSFHLDVLGNKTSSVLARNTTCLLYRCTSTCMHSVMDK